MFSIDDTVAEWRHCPGGRNCECLVQCVVLKRVVVC